MRIYGGKSRAVSVVLTALRLMFMSVILWFFGLHNILRVGVELVAAYVNVAADSTVLKVDVQLVGVGAVGIAGVDTG